MNAHQDAQEGRSAAIGAGVASVTTVDAAAVPASHTRRQVTDSPYPEWDVTYCTGCLRPWRGDAETGGCEAVLLARRVALLAGLCAEMVQAIEGHPPRNPFAIVDDMRAALADGG